jgi:fermentation-respiration switch protein FrsA (DUF1100 family)
MKGLLRLIGVLRGYGMRPARIAAIISAIYLAATAATYIYQRDLLFHPNPLRVAPADAGLAGVTEVAMSTPDGERLIAWHAWARPGQPTLFYLHGNAGALAHRAGRIKLYEAAGYGVFMLAYRGFSGSTGAPTEQRLIADALMAYDWLKALGLEDDEIVVYGESLGTGVAVRVAASRRPAGMVLESPFSSAVDVGSYAYPYLPVHWLLKDRFESLRHIGKVTAPLLVLHGEQDRIVPVRFGRKLFEAAPGPKAAYYFGEGTHYNLYEQGAFERVRGFLAGLEARRTRGTITISCGRSC